MATGSDIVTDALAEIGVFAEETPIEAADMQLGIRYLNDMLAEWDESGIPLGFTPLQSEAEEVRIPRGAVKAVKVNLAGLLSVPFRKQITPGLAASIKTASDALLRMTVKIGAVKLPSTLPKGSGNKNSNTSYFNDRFFDEQDLENF